MRLHPVVSITLGFIVSYIVFYFVTDLTLLGALGVSSSVLEVIWTVESLASATIGGFLATYFAKENKILYGICVGICWMVFFSILPALIFVGPPESLSVLMIPFLMYIGFIIASTIGSYLAIFIDKRQNLNI
jgi:hypothetical protein